MKTSSNVKKTLILLVLLCYKYTCFAQKQAFLDSTMLGKKPCQGSTKTCLGWALVYGFYSYQYNTKNSSNSSFKQFNPYIYYNTNDCNNNGISVEHLNYSISKKGVSQKINDAEFCPPTCISNNKEDIIRYSFISAEILHRNYISRENKVDLKELKGFIQNKEGFVIIYNSTGDSNDDFFSETYYWQKLKAGNNYRHAIFCIGYDDNKKAFLFRDSDRRSKHLGEVWISYKDIQNSNIIDEVISFNKSRNVSFQGEKPKFDKEMGANNRKEWWLSKSIKFLGTYKYYYIQHTDFKLTLLKFPFISKKAIIGVLNQKNQKKYSFEIRPKQSVIFSVNSRSYRFTYTKKTWGKGKNKLYPEINYTLQQIQEYKL